MKEMEHVKKFAESAPELATMFKDYANQCFAENGMKGVTYDSSISKAEKEEAINKAFSAELEKRSGVSMSTFNNVNEYGNHPSVRAFADSISNYLIDMILPQSLLASIGWLANFEFLEYGQTCSFTIENNALYSVGQAGRRQKTAPAQILRGTTHTLAPINHNVTVVVNLPDVLAGRTMIAPQIMKATMSIESQMRYEAFDAFNTTMNGSNVPTALQVANYTETSLITLCETVTAYNQGRKAVIVGTPVALKSVLPSDVATRILLEDKYVTLGYVPNFNNYDVIPMEQVADYTSSTYGLKLPNNKIWVVSPASDKLVKVAVGGTYQHTDGNYDNANLAQMGTLNKEWATAVITNSVAGVITLG